MGGTSLTTETGPWRLFNPAAFCLYLWDFSSKVEMGKWIEDLNMAIDMAKKSHEKSSIFLDTGLGDHSNRKTFC